VILGLEAAHELRIVQPPRKEQYEFNGERSAMHIEPRWQGKYDKWSRDLVSLQQN